jgi:hypothetical protein
MESGMMENKTREEFEKVWQYLISDVSSDPLNRMRLKWCKELAEITYQAGRNHPIEESTWTDTPDQWSEAIAAVHPTKTKDFATQLMLVKTILLICC